jgi:hypothetical protein
VKAALIMVAVRRGVLCYAVCHHVCPWATRKGARVSHRQDQIGQTPERGGVGLEIRHQLSGAGCPQSIQGPVQSSRMVMQLAIMVFLTASKSMLSSCTGSRRCGRTTEVPFLQ